MNVIVVGAGPAGATAARALAVAGIGVTLLDRSTFPRNKPCGGGISIRVLKRFPYLERELRRVPVQEVARLQLEGPDGESALVESKGPAALMIRRVEFDNLLVSLAVEAGATLVTGADVAQVTTMRDGVALVSRDGRCFEAPVVVAADGVHSVVARRLGINPGWKAGAVALDMMEETPRTRLRDVDPSTLWVAYGFTPPGNGGTGNGETGSRETGGRGTGNSGPAAEGYAYVFPKRDHVNVGIGYVLSHYRSHLNISPHALQRTIVTHLRGRGLLEGESVRENFTPFVIPIGGPLEHVASGRVLVAGDAGGFVNGVTAEGIYYAMVTGELAARAIVDAGANVPTLAPRYQKACNREIGRELRDSVLLQRYLFADRRRIARVVNGARRNAKLTALLLDFVQGRLSYHQLRWRLLTRSPVFAAEWLRAWKWV